MKKIFILLLLFVVKLASSQDTARYLYNPYPQRFPALWADSSFVFGDAIGRADSTVMVFIDGQAVLLSYNVGGGLLPENNLSDVASISDARNNLGVYSSQNVNDTLGFYYKNPVELEITSYVTINDTLDNYRFYTDSGGDTLYIPSTVDSISFEHLDIGTGTTYIDKESGVTLVDGEGDALSTPRIIYDVKIIWVKDRFKIIGSYD